MRVKVDYKGQQLLPILRVIMMVEGDFEDKGDYEG